MVAVAHRFFSSSMPSLTTIKPEIPLFFRPPDYLAASSELKKCHCWAKNVASYVGSSFVESDNGPDSTLLSCVGSSIGSLRNHL
jgi:release factor glutamine methyltransferase